MLLLSPAALIDRLWESSLRFGQFESKSSSTAPSSLTINRRAFNFSELLLLILTLASSSERDLLSLLTRGHVAAPLAGFRVLLKTLVRKGTPFSPFG